MPDGESVAVCDIERWLNYFATVSQSYTIPNHLEHSDCVQECCVELSILITEIDPTDENFGTMLKTRIFNRLHDCVRRERAKKRFSGRTLSVEEELESGFEFADSNNPIDTVETLDTVSVITENLSQVGRRVWSEIIDPSEEHTKAVLDRRKRARRESNATSYEIYSSLTNLSLSQVRSAFSEIRAVVSTYFREELPCLS